VGDGPSGNDRGGAGTGPAPGTLTALLHELAGAPEAQREGAWGDALVAGATIGRFQLLREVGRGGFGVVWEARDLQLGRSVAFKAVRAGGSEALREERLLREAEAAARLSHPNLVTLHDVGTTPQGAYLVMELLRGQTLAERLQRGATSPREAVRIATEVARGVAHAHAQGVIHRDLKPANVFLCSDGRVKVLDFGLAHAFGRKRAEGGTSGYMAPEQAEGAPEDERTDVYALGVMLHELLIGERPAPGPTPSGRVGRLEVAGVPTLGPLVARMLERRPVDRPRDGGAVLAALTALAHELEQAPAAAPGPVRRARPPWQRLALLAGGGVLAGAVVALSVAWWLSGRHPGAGTDGRITVAVADVANQTGDPELDGLSGLLITSLEQSRKLSVLTRVRMIDLLHQLGRTDVAVVDEALGRDLARVAGVRALVVATLRRFDQLYTLEMRVLDPATSEYLFTLKEQGTGKASVPALLDRLSEEARRRLRETPDEVAASRVRVADATTASFAAYQHYFRGDQLKEAIRYDAAIEAYRQALAADPGFTLAHYRIAYLGQFTGMEEAVQRREIEAALAGVDRVPERERLHILAWKAHLDGRDDEAHRLYAQAVERYPQDKEAQFMAGDLYLHSGKYAEALPYFERAAALDPAWEPGQMHLADSLAELGRTVELVQQATRWAERAPSASAFRALSQAHVQAGRPAEAVAASRRALDLDGTSLSRAVHAETLLLAGRYAEVEALVRPYIGPERSTLDRLGAIPALAAALAYQGRRREAVEVIRQAPAQGKGMHAAPRYMEIELTMGPRPEPDLAREVRELVKGLPPEKVAGAAVTVAALGDAGGARAMLAPDVTASARLRVEGAAAWREGRLGPALEALRQAARQDAGKDAATQYLLGEVALAAGQHAEAVQAAGTLRLVPGGMWRTWGWPRALQIQALALEKMGDRTRARSAAAELLGMWRRADPDLPGLAEARATAARLGAGG
jgi:eukaryotic-like serine/threonine-protein kinase